MFKNVFVLCTGRSGSLSFIKACKHITNYSSAHESRVSYLGEDRLNYPSYHIEADNRLSWLLGRLDEHYGNDAFYVHLLRDREATARSFTHRWEYRTGIIKAYTEGILMMEKKKGLEYCLDYYDTVNANIRLFLKDKSNVLTIHIENIKEKFPVFFDAIQAEGSLDKALTELDNHHNKTKKESKKIKNLFFKNKE